MFTDPLIVTICERFPARASIFKPSEGRPEREYERQSAVPFFATFGRSIEQVVRGKSVLDLGSGFGSQAVQYAEAEAASVVGLEVEEEKVRHSRAFLARRHVGDRVSFVVGKGEDLPFDDERFDVITMDDVLEHVINPADVLRECQRVLRPGGTLYAIFPPYYCIRGGSHLEGYATRLPGMNLIFSSRALKSGTQLYLDRLDVSWREYLRDEPTDRLWNLNGLTIRRLRRILRELQLESSVDYIGLRDRRVRTNRRPLPKPLYWLFELCARIPLAQEALCSRVALELRKPLGEQS